MKHGMTVRIIGSITILTVLIISLSVFALSILKKDSYRLERSISQIVNSAEEENWDKAKNELKQINLAWNEVKGTWAALIDHQEIDNIDVTLSRLQMLIESKDASASLSEAAALKKFINHIPDKERLSIANVF